MKSQVDVLHEEVALLASDFRTIHPILEQQISKLIQQIKTNELEKIYFFGSGDSYFAAVVVDFVLKLIPDLIVEVVNTFTLLNYTYFPEAERAKRRILVVAISSSGNSPRMLQGLQLLREKNISSLLLTANDKAQGVQLADYALVASLQNKVQSPGIRTFQVSLLGLMLLAIKLGLARDNTNESIQLIYQSLATIPFLLEDNLDSIKISSVKLAEALDFSRPIMFLASGPNYGIALYSAAKIVETTSNLAIAQDIEEWWHVERFMKPFDMPIIILAPDGFSIKRAYEIRRAATELGRNVYILSMSNRGSTNEDVFFDLKGTLPEVLTPLVFYTFSCYIAGSISIAIESRFFENKTNEKDGN